MGTAGVAGKNNMVLPNGIEDKSYRSTTVYKSSPVSLAKAVKNEAELQGMCCSHLR